MASICTDSALRELLQDVAALESARDDIKSVVNSFLNEALGYDTSALTDPADVANDVINNFTPDGLGCGTTGVPPVDDYIATCLYRLKSQIQRQISNLNSDAANVVTDLLSVAEATLFGLLQQVFGVFEQYGLNDLINALDGRITCITSADDLGTYTSDISDINDRIDAVIADLPVDNDGNFDYNDLTSGLDSGLVDNLDIFKAQSESSIASSTANLQAELNKISGSVNPTNFF